MKKATEKTPEGELFTRLILATFRLNGQLLAVGDRLTEKAGLSSALWQVLGAIDDGPLHMAQIARNMGLTRQSVRRTANILAEKGLVYFLENPDHKRAKLLVLTEKGRDILDQVNEIQVEWSNRVAEGFSAAEMSNAVQLMEELGEKLNLSTKGE